MRIYENKIRQYNCKNCEILCTYIYSTFAYRSGFSFLEIPGTEVFYIMAVYTGVLVGLPCYVVVLAAKLYFARLRAYGYEIPENKKHMGII